MLFRSKGYNFFIAEQLRNFNKKAFEQQFQKEESFVEILNRIPDGLFTFDKDWRISYFNPAAEKITGFYAQDAVGMYCDDVLKITGTGSGNALRQAINEGTPNKYRWLCGFTRGAYSFSEKDYSVSVKKLTNNVNLSSNFRLENCIDSNMPVRTSF